MLWAEPEQLRGENLRPGNVTTTRVDLTEFTLRKWDGGDPLPAGSVVTVVETRPYGSLMVAEMCHEAQASTREAIERHMRNTEGTVLLKRVEGGQDREVDVDEAFDLIATDPGAVYVALKLTPSPWIAEAVIAARDS